MQLLIAIQSKSFV